MAYVAYSSQKSPFRPLFRPFCPHIGNKSALRAEGASGRATHFLARGKRGWPQRPPGHCSPAPRSTPHAPRRLNRRGQVVRRSSPAGYCPTPTTEMPKTERGPISTSGPSIKYVTEPGDSCGQINPFLPIRRQPTVDHSLVGGGAQRHALRACLPDGQKPQCLFSHCSSLFLVSRNSPKRLGMVSPELGCPRNSAAR